jgi:NAD(P)H-dependent FMN reductase
MASSTPLIQIILGSTRDQRRGEPIARWLADLATDREDVNAELVDLATFDLPFLSGATPPMHPDSRDPAAHAWSETIGRADGYALIVPEYNHGYPAAIKNAFDHLFSEWARKPIGFVSYGAGGGGIRAVEQLRQVVVELDMVPIRRQVAIAGVWSAIGENGTLRQPPFNDAHALLDDLVWWAAILSGGRRAAAAA